MKRLDKVEHEIAKLHHQAELLRKERDELKGRKLVACENCGKKHQIRKLIYIQTHWYTPPRGCTEGDYWNPGEGQYFCPSCEHCNRMCDFNSLKWLEDYQPFFGAEFNNHHNDRSYNARHLLIDEEEWDAFKATWSELYYKEFTRENR